MLSPRSYFNGIKPTKQYKLSPVKKNFLTNKNPNGQSLWFTEKEQSLEKKQAANQNKASIRLAKPKIHSEKWQSAVDKHSPNRVSPGIANDKSPQMTARDQSRL
jgi:hypothetical protein